MESGNPGLVSSNSSAHEVGVWNQMGGHGGVHVSLPSGPETTQISLYVVCGGIRGGGRRRRHLGCHVGALSCKVDNGWPPVSIYYMHKSKVSQAVSVHLFGFACKK